MDTSAFFASRVDTTKHRSGTPEETARTSKFLKTSVLLILAFGLPLLKVFSFALKNDLYSYIVIVPFISAYLVWIEKDRLYPSGPRLPIALPVSLACLGCAFLVGSLLWYFTAVASARADVLALSMYSFVCFLGGLACHYLGRDTARVFAFPLAFLVFLAPFPAVVETGLETMLQHGSSWTAYHFLELAQMPVYREGTYFQLPGFSMQVAPECSGIRSTIALFLTSLVAGQMFLRSTWKRTTLALLVLPIALVRNGFRVFVIGELCVQIGPHMINSWIHRRGGPFFFALSLVPFSLLLYYLYKSDKRAAQATLPPR